MPFKDPVERQNYLRQYRQEHKQYFEEYRRRYYRCNKAKLDERNKVWYEDNKNLVLERGKQRYLRRKTQILEYLKNYINRPGVREKHYSRVKEYSKRDRLLVLGHYSNGKIECACCGEKQYEFLTINHVNGGGHNHRKSLKYAHLYRWLMQQNFPEGFNVLCWNCNSCLGMYGKCPHQDKKC